jgi:protein dithiol:quinone oxidoreductase
MPSFSTVLATPTKRAYAVFALCAGSLALAVVLQHALGWQPCPLCVLQRLGLLGVAIFALAAALTGTKPRVSRSMRGLASFAAFGGAFAAYQQLVLLWGPGDATCGSMLRMYVTRLADTLPALDWLLDGPADCAAEANLILGLPLAFWVLSFAVICVGALWLPGRKSAINA